MSRKSDADAVEEARVIVHYLTALIKSRKYDPITLDPSYLSEVVTSLEGLILISGKFIRNLERNAD